MVRNAASTIGVVWFFVILTIIFVVFESVGGTLQLAHADSAIGRMENGRLLRELIGHVVFSQDSSRMYCDRAIQYVDEKYVRFLGNVLISNPPRQLRADEIYYFEHNKEHLARGGAKIQDRVRILSADSLRYLELEERVLAQGRVRLVDSNENMCLSGTKMEYLRLQGYARAIGRPVFVHHDSTRSDSLVIISDYMEMKDDGAEIHAVDRVEIIQGNVRAECGRLTYYRDKESIELSLNPRARRDEDWLRGASITLRVKDRKVDAIHITGQGTVVSRVDTTVSRTPKYDFLSGEEIFVRLCEEKIDSVFVKGRATSYYHLFEQKQDKGLNKVLGDEMYMKLRDGKMIRVDVKSSPATSSGVFYPQKKYKVLATELQALIEQAMLPGPPGQPSAEGVQKRNSLMKEFN